MVNAMFFLLHHDFDWRNAGFPAYQNNIQESINIKMLQKWWFSSSRTSSNKENTENDAVLARTHFKYVRVRKTSLLRCDKEKTLEFTMDLAFRSQQDCDVVGEPQVLTDLWLVRISPLISHGSHLITYVSEFLGKKKPRCSIDPIKNWCLDLTWRRMIIPGRTTRKWWSDHLEPPSSPNKALKRGVYLENHPRTCKWLGSPTIYKP